MKDNGSNTVITEINKKLKMITKVVIRSSRLNIRK